MFGTENVNISMPIVVAKKSAADEDQMSVELLQGQVELHLEYDTESPIFLRE
jgi:hypothetical protein